MQNLQVEGQRDSEALWFVPVQLFPAFVDCRDLVAVDKTGGRSIHNKHTVSSRVMLSDLVTFVFNGLDGNVFFLPGLSSTGFGGFIVVHFRNASSRCGISQSCQLSSVHTKSPLIPSNLSSVILT